MSFDLKLESDFNDPDANVLAWMCGGWRRMLVFTPKMNERLVNIVLVGLYFLMNTSFILL